MIIARFKQRGAASNRSVFSLVMRLFLTALLVAVPSSCMAMSGDARVDMQRAGDKYEREVAARVEKILTKYPSLRFLAYAEQLVCCKHQSCMKACMALLLQFKDHVLAQPEDMYESGPFGWDGDVPGEVDADDECYY